MRNLGEYDKGMGVVGKEGSVESYFLVIGLCFWLDSGVMYIELFVLFVRLGFL